MLSLGEWHYFRGYTPPVYNKMLHKSTDRPVWTKASSPVTFLKPSSPMAFLKPMKRGQRHGQTGHSLILTQGPSHPHKWHNQVQKSITAQERVSWGRNQGINYALRQINDTAPLHKLPDHRPDQTDERCRVSPLSCATPEVRLGTAITISKNTIEYLFQFHFFQRWDPAMQTNAASKTESSCLNLPSARMTDMTHTP